jgi:hypothetical protein
LVAIDRAIGSGRGPVVVAGSLYLVGTARGHLVDDPDLRDPPNDAPNDPPTTDPPTAPARDR